MARMKYRQINRRTVAIGDRNKRIGVYERDLKEADFIGDRISEEFALKHSLWSSVESLNGVYMFDGTNNEVSVSHLFIFNFFDDIKSTDFIKYKDDYYRIVSLDNPNHDNQKLFAYCNLRGDSDDEVNHV